MSDQTGFKLNRRMLLGSGAVVGLMTAMPRIVRGAADRIVFANWGGSWEKAMRRAWAEPFTEKTGIEVVSASDNTLGKLEAMVAAGNVEWDLVETLPAVARVAAEKGLLEKLDFSIIDRSNLMDRPEFFNDYSVPEVIFGRVLTYNTGLPAKPTSFADLWDLKTFPGKRALYKRVEGGPIEIALVADGVPVDELYPLDVPRALKKLDEIKDEIIWFDSVTQSEQLMRDGQASMGVLADGRALNIKNEGASVELQPEASILTWSVFVVPKGAPNAKAAMEFLNYVLSVEAQAAEAMEYNYGPVVPAAWELIPEERLQIISGGPATKGKAIFQSAEWWAENLEEANEQFQAWLLS